MEQRFCPPDNGGTDARSKRRDELVQAMPCKGIGLSFRRLVAIRQQGGGKSLQREDASYLYGSTKLA